MNLRRAAAAAGAAAIAAVTAIGAGASVTHPGGSPLAGIVEIETDVHFQGSTWWGTGIVLTSSGAVLTNNHVIRGASSITVTDVDNGHTYRAVVAGYDVSADVALLELDAAAGLATAPLGNSALARLGERVTAFGAPEGPGTTPVAAAGRITSRDAPGTEDDPDTGARQPLPGLLWSDAPTRPGFSGGPLVGPTGKVIGMNTLGDITVAHSRVAFRSGAIPIDRARAIATAIEANPSSRTIHVGSTPLLGITVQPGALYRGLTDGATVLTVVGHSPAARAGLRTGDIVQTFDGKPLRSTDDLTSLLIQAKPGDSVNLSWLTPAGTTHAAQIRLTTGPPQ